jgi:hypothetical protein
MTNPNGLSSADPPNQPSRLENVITFWNELSCESDAGETTWGVLDEIRAKVCDCLCRDPKDLDTAEQLTAEAACRIAGLISH